MSAAFVHGRLLAGLLAVLLVGCESRRAEPAPTASASASTEAPLVVDVYTDLVCPWCFIGTERLDHAVASSGLGARVVLRHHAFLLQPDTPDEGMDIARYIRAKTGREPAEMFGRVEAVARESGIALDLTKQPRTYPTARAHALLRRAAERGTQRALERAIFRAYFLEGTDFTNTSALVAVAAQHGFTEDEARRIVNDPSELAAVRAEAQESSQRGVRGVPFFVLARQGARRDANRRRVRRRRHARRAEHHIPGAARLARARARGAGEVPAVRDEAIPPPRALIETTDD